MYMLGQIKSIAIMSGLQLTHGTNTAIAVVPCAFAVVPCAEFLYKFQFSSKKGFLQEEKLLCPLKNKNQGLQCYKLKKEDSIVNS